MKIRAFSPATVISVIALLFSVTGTAVAGALVTGANVKNGSLTGADVKTNSLGSADIKNGTIKAIDIKGGQLPAGPQGPQGPEGPQGPGGPQGPAGLSGLQIVTTFTAFNSIAFKPMTATCPVGKRVVGGGAYIQGASNQVGIVASYPASSTTWGASAYELQPVYLPNWRLVVRAVCANVAA